MLQNCRFFAYIDYFLLRYAFFFCNFIKILEKRKMQPVFLICKNKIPK